MVNAQSRRRALIVEDNKDIRNLLVQIVTAQGFTAFEAETGAEGLELVQAGAMDLITLDLNLPDMDGIDVCRKVREVSDAYVLMITARVDEIDRLDGLETGADDYISKPFSPRELQARISALFRRPRSPEPEAASGAQEREHAAEVQRSLLPGAAVLLDGYEIGGGCRPARNVGGDFFDWSATEEGLQLTVADAMGKGMGAALIAATVRAVLRTSIKHTDLDTAFNAAGGILEKDLEQAGSFATVFHARLNADCGTLGYVDAGHGLAMHLHDGGLSRLSSGGPPVGAVPGSVWTSGSIVLAPGDAMVVVSDGLLDAFDSVEAAMAAVAAVVDAGEKAQDASDAILELAQGEGITDDVTAVVVRRSPAMGGSAPGPYR
ncbi:SpoIIE family protein phosphatase [Arthrobacter monumenti]